MNSKFASLLQLGMLSALGATSRTSRATPYSFGRSTKGSNPHAPNTTTYRNRRVSTNPNGGANPALKGVPTATSHLSSRQRRALRKA